MLQAFRAALLQGTLLPATGCSSAMQAIGRACGYATRGHEGVAYANPQDYSLVMKKALEISSDIKQPENGEVGLATGIPLDTYNRKARIYSAARTASQSGLAKTNHNSSAAPSWKIEFDTTAKWENPLMGWTSTADPLENVGRASLFFYSKEQAIAFCKKHGWDFEVTEPNAKRNDRQKRWAGYGDNFSVKRKGVPDLSHLPSNRGESAKAETAEASK